MEKNRQQKESYLLQLFLFLMPLLVQNMVNAKNTRLAKTRQLRARQPRVFLPIPLRRGATISGWTAQRGIGCPRQQRTQSGNTQ